MLVLLGLLMVLGGVVLAGVGLVGMLDGTTAMVSLLALGALAVVLGVGLLRDVRRSRPGRRSDDDGGGHDAVASPHSDPGSVNRDYSGDPGGAPATDRSVPGDGTPVPGRSASDPGPSPSVSAGSDGGGPGPSGGPTDGGPSGGGGSDGGGSSWGGGSDSGGGY